MDNPGFHWTEDEFTLSEFVDSCRDILPQIICIKDGFDDEETLHSFASDEVYVIRSLEVQTRVVVRDRAHRLLSIPLEYPLYMHVVHRDGRAITQVQRPKRLKQILRRIVNHECRDNHVVFQENHAVKIQSAPGCSYETKCEVLEIVDVHQLTYLVGSSLINGSLYPAITVIPVYLPIHVSVGLNLLTTEVNTLDQYLLALLEDAHEEIDENDLNLLFNKDIMVVSDDEINVPEGESTEDSLRRVIIHTKEYKISLNTMDTTPQRPSLGKRMIVDRTSLPPPPPPPIPELSKPTSSVNGRPHTVHIPTSRMSAVSIGGEIGQGPALHKKHFNFHSLLPSGHFPSLEKIKKKVRKKCGKKRNYPLTMDDSFIPNTSTIDMVQGSTAEGKAVSYLSDYDDDQWSDDSFDSEDDVHEAEPASLHTPSEQTVALPSGLASEVEEVTTELMSKLKIGLGDKSTTHFNQLCSETTVHGNASPSKNQTVGNGSQIKLKSEVKINKSHPPITISKPCLPMKPKGHLQRLSSEVSTDTSSQNNESRSNKLKASYSGGVTRRSEVERPHSCTKPRPPPKPKGKSSAGEFINKSYITKKAGKSTGPSSKGASNVKVNSQLQRIKPAISKKPERLSKLKTEEVPSEVLAMQNQLSKIVDKGATICAEKSENSSRQNSKFEEMKMKFDANEYDDIHIPPSRLEVVAAASGENVYDEVYHYIPTKSTDRSAGDGAEMIEKGIKSDGKNGKVTPNCVSGARDSFSRNPSVASSSESGKPLKLDSIEDLYAKPLSLKQRKLAVVSPSSNKVNITPDPKVIHTKYSSLADVPFELAELSVQDVIECLALLKMAQYGDKFKENEIDGALLGDLDEDILQSMFSFSPFDAKKLVKFSSGWRPRLH